MNDFLDHVSSCELIVFASIFAIMISQGLTSDEIGTLSSFFCALGDNLGIISSNGSCPSTNNFKKDDFNPRP